MKCRYFITFLFSFILSFSAQAENFESYNPQLIPGVPVKPLDAAVIDARKDQLLDMLKEAAKKSKSTPEYMFEEKSTRVAGCSHCPRYFELTDSVNKVLEELKKTPNVEVDEEVPLSINRLRFLFYMVQSREANGVVRCQRFMDTTEDLRPTKFDGEMKLVAEDVFKFEGITQFQLIDNKAEVVTYYYRGTGKQKNVIVQAILTKDGGKFRYYYLNTDENNPYNLPALSDEDLTPKERKQKKLEEERLAREYANGPRFPEEKAPETPGPTGPASKDKMEWEVDPKLETRMKYIPKNIHIAKGAVSQGLFGSGVRINADTLLTAKGNKANVVLQNEEGKSFVEVTLDTSINGKTERKITIPYEVRLGAKDDKDAFELKGKLEDHNTLQTITLSLTDRYTQYLRTEYRTDKNTNLSSVTVAKDFSLGPAEAISVAVGKNEAKTKFASLQHRKSIKGNISMVLDVRVDENRQTSFYYQLQSKF